MRHAVKVIALGASLFAWGWIVGLGCGPSQEAKSEAADSAYLAEHLRCVEQYDIRAQIDACRHAVRIRWGIAETVKEGGRDG